MSDSEFYRDTFLSSNVIKIIGGLLGYCCECKFNCTHNIDVVNGNHASLMGTKAKNAN